MKTHKSTGLEKDIEGMLNDIKEHRQMVIASILFAIIFIPILLLSTFLIYTQ